MIYILPVYRTGLKNAVPMPLHQHICLTCMNSCIWFYCQGGRDPSYMDLKTSYFTSQKHEIFETCLWFIKINNALMTSKCFYEWTVAYNIWRLTRPPLFFGLPSWRKNCPVTVLSNSVATWTHLYLNKICSFQLLHAD